MRRWIALVVLLLGFSLHADQEKEFSVPYLVVDFRYDWRGRLMDFLGSFYFDASMEDLRAQANLFLPRFIEVWDREAPVLFGEIEAAFHKGIADPNRTAVINLSHGNSYGSSRFLIFGLRGLLESSWDYCATREEAFSALVFHELLHVWVDDNLCKEKSLLLQKYSEEDACVLEHLHLMAIQKMVYTRMQRLDLLDYLDEWYKNSDISYRRAWEIVNVVEGWETVLMDIELQIRESSS